LRAEHEKRFAALKRTLRAIIPGVEDLKVDLDKRRGTLDIEIRQDGIDFSSRIVSEGTLRVLALCAIAVNPWGGTSLAFEEPENGVHPRRIELIAELLASLVDEKRQVIVTTHSPLFCNTVVRLAQSRPNDIALFQVTHRDGATRVARFDPLGPLFSDTEIRQALAEGNDDGLFESLLLRGLLDA
jgi:predicted ATPase